MAEATSVRAAVDTQPADRYDQINQALAGSQFIFLCGLCVLCASALRF